VELLQLLLEQKILSIWLLQEALLEAIRTATPLVEVALVVIVALLWVKTLVVVLLLNLK
jgi:hypothetical protein